jgi:PKD repeat protein
VFTSSVVRRVFASVAAAALAIVGLSAVPAVADSAPASSTEPVTVAADGLPTVQINKSGTVWSQTTVGNTVYVGGSFTSARPAGAAAGVNEVARTYLLAYDITTGVLISSFNHTLDGQVRSVTASPDGSRVYIAGDFTHVDGQYRVRVAAFNTADGSLVASFRPTLASAGLAVAATNSTVYVGGNFTQVAGVTGGTLVPKSYLAAFSATDGSVQSFQADADAPVTAVAVTTDGSRVVVGGRFTSLSGTDFYGLGSVDPVTGAGQSLPANQYVRDAGDAASITSLYANATGVYGTGYVYGSGGNSEGTFRIDAATGALIWYADCHGDTYSVFQTNDVVYDASHHHYCGNIGGFPQTDPWTFYRAGAFTTAATGVNTADIYGYASHTGQPSPTLLNWYPDLTVGTATGQSQAAWSVTGNADYLSYGGEFPYVNSVAQQGLVRFAVPSLANNTQGPRLHGNTFDPTITSNFSGEVRIAMHTNWDRDNETLTYTLYRGTEAAKNAIWQQTVTTPFWDPKTMVYTDTGLTPGSSTQYRLTATDAFGNVARSNWLPVTVSSTAKSDYAQAVLTDNPQSWWRLSDDGGATTVQDWAGSNSASAGTGVTFGTAGAIGGDTNTAATFSGTSAGLVAGQTQLTGPQVFSIEAWFKTTSTSGGKIVGFGSSATGTSSSYDRHVYMLSNGRIAFGVYPGAAKTVTSAASYNDGQRHQVTATLGSGGMMLYLDGKRVAMDASVTSAQAYSGYWRIGGDTSWSGNSFFAGSIDDVAVYDTVLTKQQVDAHWVASGRTSALPQAPSDAYGQAVFGLDPALYWRLDEHSSSTAVDSGQYGDSGQYLGKYTQGVTGALAAGTGTAVTLQRPALWELTSTHGLIVASQQVTNPTVYSEELWFSTTTSLGGKLIGFGDGTSGTSSNYDRHVYMTTDGRLNFGVWTGDMNVITSPSAYNDGAWHHMVATQGSDGMKLYVDGQLVASGSQTQAQAYSGYWRIGGDSSWSGDNWFDGSIDEAAVYNTVLTSAQVQQHWILGSGATPRNAAPTASFTATATDLGVAVDATASNDSDGTVVSYAWNFGDGTTGSGATASHTYASAGTYTVTLTVTDNQGGTGESTQQVSVVAPNQLPTAAFGSTESQLTASFDASGSSDPDGSIASYAWDFGDGQSGDGVTTSHTYTSTGTYTVTLTVTDDRGGQATSSAQVSVAAPNQPPTAAFTDTVTGLSVTFDGSGSTDPDGTIASYAWDFGDSATGSGANASHAYAAAGTYTVTLTATDNDGANASVQHQVTVAAPTTAVTLASDTFTRSVSGGWGSADLGGDWTLNGALSRYSVDGTTGHVNVAAGSTLTGTLGSVVTASSSLQVTLGQSALANGGGAMRYVMGRQVSSGVYYGARIKTTSTGAVDLRLVRSGTLLTGGTVAGLTLSDSESLIVKLEVDGVSPTTLRVKVWKAGQTEPADWSLTTTDDAAGLQVPGAVAISSYVSVSATNAPISFTVDDLTVRTVGPAAANQPPVAAFTSTTNSLAVTVDGSSSHDPDGAVAGYAWTFGDGSTGSGVTADHTYAAAGTYPVTLTVTDNAGATATTSANVTVSAPVQGAALATDTFGRTEAAGWGTADLGGSWIVAGSTSLYSVGSGVGVFQASKGGQSPRAQLATFSAQDVDITAQVIVPALPSAGTNRVWVAGRSTGWGQEYYLRANLSSTGAVSSVQLIKRVGGVDTTIGSAVVNGLTLAAGETLDLRLQLSGTNPTTLNGKVWKSTSPEPSTWTLSATDSQNELQGAGSIELGAYVATTTTNLPFAIQWDNVGVTGL